jgi:hypothetical protein
MTSISLEKLKALADSLPRVPRIEFRIGIGQANALIAALRGTFPIEKSEWPETLQASSQLAAVPIIEHDIYQAGLGAFLVYDELNIPHVYLLDWRSGDMKVFDLKESAKNFLDIPTSLR